MTEADRLHDPGATEHLEGFVDGVPSWLRPTLGFCSRCGSPLTLGEVPGEHRERLWCTSCGFIAYVNPRMVVTTLPVTEARVMRFAPNGDLFVAAPSMLTPGGANGGAGAIRCPRP